MQRPFKQTNVDRANDAEHVIDRYSLDTTERRKVDLLTPQGRLSRLLADLRHYARLHGLDWTEAMSDSATTHGVESQSADLQPIPDSASE